MYGIHHILDFYPTIDFLEIRWREYAAMMLQKARISFAGHITFLIA